MIRTFGCVQKKTKVFSFHATLPHLLRQCRCIKGSTMFDHGHGVYFTEPPLSRNEWSFLYRTVFRCICRIFFILRQSNPTRKNDSPRWRCLDTMQSLPLWLYRSHSFFGSLGVGCAHTKVGLLLWIIVVVFSLDGSVGMFHKDHP
jgi:hypothetical protein